MAQPVVSTRALGTDFTRTAMVLAHCRGNLTNAEGYAEAQYGYTSVPTSIIRASAVAGTTADTGWASQLSEYRAAGRDFCAAVRPQTILGKMSGYRTAPFRTKIPRVTAGTTVAWVGERSASPLSELALDLIEIDNYKVSGIVCTSAELADMSTPSAEALVRSDLIAATAAMMDRSFINPAFAGEAGVSPPAITADNGVVTFAASGTTAAACRTDLRRLFRCLTDEDIGLANPYLIMNKRTAIALAFFAASDGWFDGVGVNGGTLAGCPVIVSNAVPTTSSGNSPPDDTSSIVLVDASELTLADDGIATIEMSRQASLQFETSPDSPSTAAVIEKSLWQHGLVAWRITREINWQLRRSEACAAITSANYNY